MQITGNTVFIPGATSGIGLALAIALHERGNNVIVGGRRVELLERIRSEHAGIDTVEIDTADPQSIAVAAEKVLAAHPDLNVLIAMAGIMRAEDWHTPGGFLASAEATVTTNLLGPIRLIGAFIEHLQTRKDAVIMTVSSGLAFVPLKVTPSYNATKAAIHQLSSQLASELAPRNITVNALIPGYFPTAMTAHLQDDDGAPAGMLAGQIPLGRFGIAADIAGAVQFLASRAGAYVTGSKLVIDGGLSGCR